MLKLSNNKIIIIFKSPMGEENFRGFWDEAYNLLKEEYKANGHENEFNLWFNMSYVEDSISDNSIPQITVSVPSDFMWNSMITKGYISAIQSKIEELLGMTVTINYVVKKKETTLSVPINSSNQEDKTDKSISSDTIKHEESVPKKQTHPQLNSDLRFENFVIGDNSDFAYSVSLAAAKNPGHGYSPLLLYGGTGLGKTHLMQSIGNYIFENPPEGKENLKIIYLTTENFINEFTHSIREKSTDKFKKKYRNVDVLLLDDIHFLLGKDSTQEELFYTFEALYNKKAQIVFTCDRPLSELKGIEERLMSRFKLGTPIDLQPPSYETRKAILLKKMELKGKKIPDDVIDYIARNVHSNVRELESCLNTMINYSELLQKPLTIDVAKKKLSDSLNQIYDSNVTIDDIQKVVASHYNISLSDIKSEKRNKKFVFPRQIAVYISRKLTEYSFPEIGNEFGGRDHTTIMHSYEKIEDLLKTDSSLNSTIELLIRESKEYKRI